MTLGSLVGERTSWRLNAVKRAGGCIAALGCQRRRQHSPNLWRWKPTWWPKPKKPMAWPRVPEGLQASQGQTEGGAQESGRGTGQGRWHHLQQRVPGSARWNEFCEALSKDGAMKRAACSNLRTLNPKPEALSPKP